MGQPKRLQRRFAACGTGDLPIGPWPLNWWTRQEWHRQTRWGSPDYSPAGLTALPNPSAVLAGRVGLESTFISVTGRPPANGAPAKAGATGTIRTFIALAFNQALYRLELPLRISVAALGRLPGPVSPHRYPDSLLVPLYSPSPRQAVSNDKATGPEPNQVLPHPLATSQAPQSCSRWLGNGPPAYKAGALTR